MKYIAIVIFITFSSIAHSTSYIKTGVTRHCEERLWLCSNIIETLNSHEKHDIKFIPTTLTNEEELINNLEDHKILVAIPAIQSLSPSGVLISEPLITQRWSIVTRKIFIKNENSVKLEKQRVAVINGQNIYTTLLKLHPSLTVEKTASFAQALSLLNSGAVDGIICESAQASLLVSITHPNMLSKTDIPDIKTYLHMWIAPGEYATLDEVNYIISETPKKLFESMYDKGLVNEIMSEFNTYKAQNTPNALVITSVTISLILIAFLSFEILRRRLAERELLDAVTYWKSLFNNIPSPLLICSPVGIITHCNEYLTKSIKLERCYLIGKTLDQFVDEYVISPSIRHNEIAYALSNRKPQFSERTIVIDEKTHHIFHWMVSYVDSRMTPQGLILGWYDMSERKRLEKELAIALKNETHANRAKSDFLAKMSHEIRSPMNIIHGILELEYSKESHNKNNIGIAFTATQQLLKLIGDILDISRIEAGEVQSQQQNCDLHSLLLQEFKTHEIIAKNKGLLLQKDIDSCTGTYYFLDVSRLLQILNNLLSNAIKYTNHGYVTLECFIDNKNEEQDFVTLKITDTGIGIPENMLDKIIHPYTKVDPSSPQSTGLGLAICSQLLNIMDSELIIESNIGEGSSFKFTLLLDRALKQTEVCDIETENHNHKKLTVLVIDDQMANLIVMKLQLESLGHIVFTCDKPYEACKIIENNTFDIVFTDCQMPLVDGYQIARIQRAHERGTQRHQTIIACTANALNDEEFRCLQSGMDSVLIKPITLQNLSTAISEQQSIKLDMTEINTLTSKDFDTLNKFIVELQKSSENELSILRDGNIDSRTFKDSLHRQKGSFSLAGFYAGVNICMLIEGLSYDDNKNYASVLIFRLINITLVFISLLEKQKVD